MDTQTGTLLNTKFDCKNGDPSMNGDLRTFIGWLDDNTFLGRIDLDASDVADPVQIVPITSASSLQARKSRYSVPS